MAEAAARAQIGEYKVIVWTTHHAPGCGIVGLPHESLKRWPSIDVAESLVERHPEFKHWIAE